MARNTVTYVVSGECCFLAMMGCCFALEPSWVAVRQGLSYYGNYVPTGIPFVIGFGSSIALTGLGVARIRPRGATVSHCGSRRAGADGLGTSYSL
jgi:hypothetical protein